MKTRRNSTCPARFQRLSAHRHDLDVELYLADITRQILSGSTDYVSLLPDIWKQSHPDAVRQYRVEERRDKADRSRYEAATRRAG